MNQNKSQPHFSLPNRIYSNSNTKRIHTKIEAFCQKINRSFTEEKQYRLCPPPPEFPRAKPIWRRNFRNKSKKPEKTRRGETTTTTTNEDK